MIPPTAIVAKIACSLFKLKKTIRYKSKGGVTMEINSIMSSQLAQLQQTLQMSILDKTLNAGAGVVEMLAEMPAPAAEHPYKGQLFDAQV